MKPISKTTLKSKVKEEFEKFLAKNEYGIYTDPYFRNSYSIRKNKPTEKIQTYYIDDVLSSNLESILTPNVIFQFISEQLQVNNGEIALFQCIRKSPPPSASDYNKHITSILKTLNPYKKQLIKYVSRNTFLENSWGMIAETFNIIDDIEKRTAIIEVMTTTKKFRDLDVQKNIYNLVQVSFKNPQYFDKYFDRIKKIEPNTSVLDFVSTPGIIIFGFSSDKLIGANLNTKINSFQITSQIESIPLLIKEKFNTDLNIISSNLTKVKNEFQLHIICPQELVPLNRFVFEEFINKIIKFNSVDELNNFKTNELDLFIKESKIKYLYNSMQDNMATNIELKVKKNKI